MSYSEENGQVVLRMSREDYQEWLSVFCARVASGLMQPGKPHAARVVEIQGLLNRLKYSSAWTSSA